MLIGYNGLDLLIGLISRHDQGLKLTI